MYNKGELGREVMLDDANPHDVNRIRAFLQKEQKKRLPYLSGIKICNWMYVIRQYTNQKYKNIESLAVALDTHVCKATFQLDLITEEEFKSSQVQAIMIKRWQTLLKHTKYNPIDVHTPLWL